MTDDEMREFLEIEGLVIETGRTHESIREERRQEKVDAICLGCGALVLALLVIQGLRGRLRNPFRRARAWE